MRRSLEGKKPKRVSGDCYPSKEGHSTALGSKCKLVAFRHFLFCRLGGGGGGGRDKGDGGGKARKGI